MTFNPDEFDVLRRISKRPNSNQRTLAKELGFSLGKLNYCIKGLQERGMLKLKFFKSFLKSFIWLNIFQT